MRTIFIIAAGLVLAGCEASQAEDDYRFLVDNDGTPAEKCAAALKVRDAYAADKNSANYERWKNLAIVECAG